MGAYGSALIAYDQWVDLTAPKPGEPVGAERHELKSGIASYEDLEKFHVDLELRRCGKCQNNCLLTINTFSTDSVGGKDGKDSGSDSTGRAVRRFVTGNRCERGAVRT